MKSLLVLCICVLLGVTNSARLRRQAVEPEAPPAEPATTPSTSGMNIALGFIVDELEKEESLGGPVNPAGLKKATVLATKIQLLGGAVDEPTGDKLASLTADFVAEAAADPGIDGFMAKPTDTKVNVPMAGF